NSLWLGSMMAAGWPVLQDVHQICVVKPFLLALQPLLVNLGEKVTLECRSEIMFDTFILTSHKKGTIKDSLKLFAEHHLGGSQANFSIGPVTPDHAGTYKCYGSYNHSPYDWSYSSDPIDIKITGLYKKPSLSALMGPVVMSGENMTLSCVSDLQFDMFHLSREGVPKGHGLPSVQNNNGTFQADFLLGPVVQAGNYRCYGSFRNTSHLWIFSSVSMHRSWASSHNLLWSSYMCLPYCVQRHFPVVIHIYVYMYICVYSYMCVCYIKMQYSVRYICIYI
uniref:Immunoglobulin domain-containing protein n=1 Tax=Peromyscus maniculatus bairdii TaxID=230844 RepID=A0A8C8UGL1_PERMB